MNKVILMGRLCADPEITVSSGLTIAKYRLAVDRAKKKDGTQEADFISCVAFEKSAEFARDYLKKGIKIALEGRIQTRTWDKDGEKRNATEVVVERQYFCERKADGAPATAPALNPNGSYFPTQTGYAQRSQAAPAPSYQQNAIHGYPDYPITGTQPGSHWSQQGAQGAQFAEVGDDDVLPF